MAKTDKKSAAPKSGTKSSPLVAPKGQAIDIGI